MKTKLLYLIILNINLLNCSDNGFSKLTYDDLIHLKHYTSNSNLQKLHADQISMMLGKTYNGSYNYGTICSNAYNHLKKQNAFDMQVLCKQRDYLAQASTTLDNDLAILATIQLFNSTYTLLFIILRNILLTVYDDFYERLNNSYDYNKRSLQERNSILIECAFARKLIQYNSRSILQNAYIHSYNVSYAYQEKIKQEIYLFVPHFIKVLDEVIQEFKKII